MPDVEIMNKNTVDVRSQMRSEDRSVLLPDLMPQCCGEREMRKPCYKNPWEKPVNCQKEVIVYGSLQH